MVFTEKRKYIKARNPFDEKYIREFNTQYNNNNSPLLDANQWDVFTDFVNKRKPEELLTLEYYTTN